MLNRTERIANVVAVMCENWRQKPSDATFELFTSGLDDLPIEAVELAVWNAVRDGSRKFMPTLGELRQLAGARGMIVASDRPVLAWEAVRRAISQVGAYHSTNFDDPIITASIRAMGGWIALCDSTLDELVWREKDFKHTYSALSTIALADEQTASLVGIVEKANGPDVAKPMAAVGCLTTGGYGVVRRLDQPQTARIAGRLPSVEKLSRRLTFDDRTEQQLKSTPTRTRDEQIAALLSEGTFQ